MFLLGDAAIGSPYFQSISLGFEQYVYKQWLRVYMCSKVIKHNKDLFECVDDRDAVLEQLHLY